MNKLVLTNDSHFIIDMMYARIDNVLQRAVYSEIGFGNEAYVHEDVYKQLFLKYYEKVVSFFFYCLNVTNSI